MSGKEKREEIRRKVESYEFLRETFDYDADGFLLWKIGSGRRNAGKRAGSFDDRKQTNRIDIEGVRFTTRRLVWLWHGNCLSCNSILLSKNGDLSDDRIENLKLIETKFRTHRDRSPERNISLLRSLFEYDSETGNLFTKARRTNQPEGLLVKGKTVLINRACFAIARICFVVFHGRPIADGMFIDHADGNYRNNKISNLREATCSQNNMNCRRSKTKGSGLPKGVFYDKSTCKFRAIIRIAGRKNSLGYFGNAEEASIAYQEAAKLHFGEFACFDR